MDEIKQLFRQTEYPPEKDFKERLWNRLMLCAVNGDMRCLSDAECPLIDLSEDELEQAAGGTGKPVSPAGLDKMNTNIL